MFHSKLKKTAITELNNTIEKYNLSVEETVRKMEILQECRCVSVRLLKEIEEYVSSLANRPREYEKLIGEIKYQINNFEERVSQLTMEGKKAAKAGTVAGAGALAGVGVAALGPSAAMAVAMTFGTASTGTAIATLSGAAATNAALAWLGGGALAVGGAGVAGGQAFLALTGPIGWTIGAVSLVGSGVYLNMKNKSIVKEAEQSNIAVIKEKERIEKLGIEVTCLTQDTSRINRDLSTMFSTLKYSTTKTYDEFSEYQINTLAKAMNLAEVLSKKISVILGECEAEV